MIISLAPQKTLEWIGMPTKVWEADVCRGGVKWVIMCIGGFFFNEESNWVGTQTSNFMCGCICICGCMYIQLHCPMHTQFQKARNDLRKFSYYDLLLGKPCKKCLQHLLSIKWGTRSRHNTEHIHTHTPIRKAKIKI